VARSDHHGSRPTFTRLAELTTSDDTAARSELFEDLHGLVATATHLYHAVGIDLTTTIRIPDTDALARNRTQRRNLCTFLAKTVPKQSVYGVHSGYRMLFEDRRKKLCRRLPSEIEPDTQLDLTMSWVLAGPTITALKQTSLPHSPQNSPMSASRSLRVPNRRPPSRYPSSTERRTRHPASN